MADYIPSIFTSKSSYINVLCTGGTAPIEAERSLPMAREKELFRANLEQLNTRFPDKESLSYTDLCSLFDCSYRTAIRKWGKMYNKVIGGVPKTTVARAMCQ